MEGESRWACPNCGACRLALEELPNVGALGAQPLSDLIGMGDPIDRPLPGIVCLNCGRHWPNPEAVFAEAEAGSAPAAGRIPVTGDRGGRHVVVLADDLIWQTRLVSVLESLGAKVERVRTADDFEAALGAGEAGDADFAIVDLTARAYQPVPSIELAHAKGVRVLGVGQHDDLPARKAALGAGAERVFAYRKLFEDGPATLQAWLEGPGPSRGGAASTARTSAAE